MTQIKSKQRVADHGEVFTHEREVNAMLDLVAKESFDKIGIETTFLEPACGTGNFLMAILRRKLAEVKSKYYRKTQPELRQTAYEFHAILVISSLYGIEKLQDNALTCRRNLLAIFEAEYRTLYPENTHEKCLQIADFLLQQNILHGDALEMVYCNENNEPIAGDFLCFSQWAAVSFPRKWCLKRHDFIYQALIAQGGKAQDHNGDPYRSVQQYFPCYFLEIENAKPSLQL